MRFGMNHNLDIKTRRRAKRVDGIEHPVPLTGISKAIKRFNRNTTWVATGLLAPVIFAAVMVALQERHAKADDITKEERQTTGDPLVNANPPAISDIVGSNEKSTGEITSAQVTSVDRGLTSEIKHPRHPAERIFVVSGTAARFCGGYPTKNSQCKIPDIRAA